MKKILLITYAFSPQSTPESILSAKLFANLKNIETDVVTIKHPIPGSIDLDPSLENYIKKYFNNVYRCDLSMFFKAISILNLKKFFSFPDYYRLLNNKIYEFIVKNINLEKYDHIITWSQSHSIHLVGLRLKKNFILDNWITYFSDPWSDNPFFNRSYLGFEKLFNIINEKKVFMESKKIICTSVETKELIGKKYDFKIQDKIFVIPHCFDRKLYLKNHDNLEIDKKKITFRYIGKFYGKRFPNILIDALKIIEKKDIDIFKKINFEVYGSQNFLVTSKILYFKKYIKSFGPLSYSKSLQIMQNSDYLLVIDAPFRKSVFFPSKLVDYMGSSNKVIGITPPGTAREVIKKMGGYTFSHENSIELADQILNLLKVKDSKNNLNEEFINSFSSEQVGLRFQKLLNT